MSITLDGSLGITTPMYNGTVSANQVTPSVNMKNRIINGAMVIDQRNAGASVTVGSNGYFTIDRFKTICNGGGGYTIQQNAGSVTPPVGFTKYVGMTVSTTSAGSNYYALLHNIEGYNVADLGFGTANAKTITLSFWVRSSLTGTFGGAFNNDSDRSYPFTYTISSANTWEQKTVTIVGDTTGTWGTTTGVGLQVAFALGSSSTYYGTAGSWQAGYLINASGATNVIGTNGATLYITGVQLEVGSSATSFDYRPYGTELQLCQRYYWRNTFGNLRVYSGYIYNTTLALINVPFPVQMRTTPTSVEASSPASNWGLAITNGANALTSVPSLNSANTYQAEILANSTSLTAGQGCALGSNSGYQYLGVSAEL